MAIHSQNHFFQIRLRQDKTANIHTVIDGVDKTGVTDCSDKWDTPV